MLLMECNYNSAGARAIINVLGHKYLWLTRGYNLEI